MNERYRKGLMLVLSSPSGAGKTSICKNILSLDSEIQMSVSYTTRTKRRSEKHSEDYFFITKEKFEALKNQNFFVEHANVFDNWYGTPKKFIEDSLSKGIDVMFDIDWQGAQKLSEFSKNDVVSIFILPPSNKILLDRLKKRAEDSNEIVSMRMNKAKFEISHWIEYDYVIINDDLDKCSQEVLNILRAERKKRNRQKFIFDFIEKLLN